MLFNQRIDVNMQSQFNLPEIQNHPDKPMERQLDQSSVAIILCDDLKQLNEIPYEDVLQWRIKDEEAFSDNTIVWSSILPNKRATTVMVCQLSDATTAFDFTEQLSKGLKKRTTLAGEVTIVDLMPTQSFLKLSLRTVLAHNAQMPIFKSESPVEKRIEYIGCYNTEALNLDETLASHHGNALARYLSILPTNHLTPKIYVDEVKTLAKSEDWDFSFYDTKKLQKCGAGAFLAVARASESAGIVKLTYTPEASTEQETMKRLALVGKGVCFDTGGVSLKAPEYMYGMHEDMEGSAVALGIFLMLSRLRVSYDMECWLAIVDNKIDSQAFLPNEVITTVNGTTIAIVDTDAEGRLILADTLALASESKPDLILDYATLTGGSLRAVGTRYATVFTNQDDWLVDLIHSGTTSGERVWPMPMTDDYLEDIKSDVADLKQCNVSGPSDHIHAAKLLQKFVAKETKWVHVDMAASCHKGGLGAVPTDFTGFGVWFTLDLLKQLKF